MDQEDTNESSITLESINKKLESLECKIDKLPKNSENEKFFIATMLVSLSFVLISISIPLLIQLLELQNLALWLTCISYFIFGISFLLIVRKLFSK